MMRKRISIHLGKRLPKNFVQPKLQGFTKWDDLWLGRMKDSARGCLPLVQQHLLLPLPPTPSFSLSSLLACRPMHALPGDSCSFLGLIALCSSLTSAYSR